MVLGSCSSAFSAAADAGVPVVTIDRKVTNTACEDYLTFLGSDFVDQGKRAADQMIEATGGKGEVAILLGAAGNNVTTERTKGFKDQIAAKAPDLKVVFEQTGEFAREKGQQVTEQLIQSNPDIKGIYAENDEMGLGALAALDDAGKAGTKSVHIVSIDGTKGAVQAIVDGNFDAVIESNPAYGPSAQAALDAYVNGGGAPAGGPAPAPVEQ